MKYLDVLRAPFPRLPARKAVRKEDALGEQYALTRPLGLRIERLRLGVRPQRHRALVRRIMDSDQRRAPGRRIVESALISRSARSERQVADAPPRPRRIAGRLEIAVGGWTQMRERETQRKRAQQRLPLPEILDADPPLQAHRIRPQPVKQRDVPVRLPQLHRQPRRLAFRPAGKILTLPMQPDRLD